MRKCVYPGCSFTYDENNPADQARYTAHLEGHAATISSTSKVPDLSGLRTEEEIRERLRQANLRLGAVRRFTRQWTPLGVVAQVPIAGTSVPLGTEVDVDINEENATGSIPPLFGPAPRATGGRVPMPRVIGMTEDEAQKELRRYGLRLTSANTYKVHDEYARKGEVMYQWPEPGTPVDPNDPTVPKVQICVGKPSKGSDRSHHDSFWSRIWHWGDDSMY